MENKNNDNVILPGFQVRSLVDYNSDNDKAIIDYDEAIKLNPNNADAYKYRGIAYFIKGDYDQAIADFTKIIQLKSSDNTAYINRNIAYYNRGITYINKGRNDLAIKDFNIIIEYNQNDIDTLYNRGVAYYNIGDFSNTISDWEVVKRIDSSFKNINQKLDKVREKIMATNSTK